MSRLAHTWRAMEPEQRLAALASVAMLVTMFFPWYGLQSVKKGEIKSHTINAFGDISFVEAAVFLVAAGVIAMLIARVEGREFHLPGGDGTIVLIAGGWASLLIFYRVFDRPAGHGYPVGIEWGFFLAFVSAGALTYAGWRIRAAERLRAEPGRARRQAHEERAWQDDETFSSPAEEPQRAHVGVEPSEEVTTVAPAAGRPRRATPAPARPRAAPAQGDRRPARGRPRFPPEPSEQMSFEDPPPGEQRKRRSP